MAKYFGSTSAAKVYPKDAVKPTVGIEMDKTQALKMRKALTAFINDPETKGKRLIVTAYKNRMTAAGNVPMTFIAGKK